MLGIVSVFYALNAFESAKRGYDNTLKIYIKQNLLEASNSLIPVVLQKANEIYKQDPYTPYYKYHFNIDGFNFEVLIKDDTHFNINLIKDKSYFEFFQRLSKAFCMPRDFPNYILYWIGGKANIDISNLNYPPPLNFMGSRQELVYAYYMPSLIYQNNCDKSKKGIYYYIDTHNGPMNINTAPKIILMSLDPNITSFIAEEIIEYRKKQPIKHLNDLLNINGISVDDIYKLRKISKTKSSVLIVYIRSYYRIGGIYQNLYTKIYYDPNSNRIISIRF